MVAPVRICTDELYDIDSKVSIFWAHMSRKSSAITPCHFTRFVIPSEQSTTRKLNPRTTLQLARRGDHLGTIIHAQSKRRRAEGRRRCPPVPGKADGRTEEEESTTQGGQP